MGTFRRVAADRGGASHAPGGERQPLGAWYRPLFELIKKSALVNPIKKTEERRCGIAAVGRLAVVVPPKGQCPYPAHSHRRRIGAHDAADPTPSASTS